MADLKAVYVAADERSVLDALEIFGSTGTKKPQDFPVMARQLGEFE